MSSDGGAPYLGVSAYDGWLYQARIGGLMLNLRLYTPDGEGVTFQEKLCAAQTGGEKDIRLCIRQGNRDGGLMLQLDQHVIDVFNRVGITETFWQIWIFTFRRPIRSRPRRHARGAWAFLRRTALPDR